MYDDENYTEEFEGFTEPEPLPRKLTYAKIFAVQVILAAALLGGLLILRQTNAPLYGAVTEYLNTRIKVW